MMLLLVGKGGMLPVFAWRSVIARTGKRLAWWCKNNDCRQFDRFHKGVVARLNFAILRCCKGMQETYLIMRKLTPNGAWRVMKGMSHVAVCAAAFCLSNWYNPSVAMKRSFTNFSQHTKGSKCF